MTSKSKDKNAQAYSFLVILGLGNPGSKYEKTYHNVGSQFVDHLLETIGNGAVSGKSKNFKFWKVNHLFLVKSLTYMNNSGLAAKECLSKFGLPAKKILVVHDDSDLSLGQYKLSFNRSSAGHHGVKSVINHLNTSEIWRLRIGIRPIQKQNLDTKNTTKPREKASKFVLKKISRKDRETLQSVFKGITEKLIENSNP